MPPRDETHNIAPPNTNHRSILVTISARALGSLGFGLSILAIWLHWLVPSLETAHVVVEKTPQQTSQRLRRRPPFTLPPRPVQLLITTGQDDNRSKHVYFKDSPPPSLPLSDLETPEDHPVQDSSSEDSPRPSSSQSTTSAPKQDNESINDSDSSSRRSLSLHLPKRIHPFKFRHHSEPSVTSPHEGKHNRRSSIGFAPPWSTRRKSTDIPSNANEPMLSDHPPNLVKSASLKSTSADSIQSPITSYFSLKSHRRASTPVTRTRTQPYEAPYFAMPPTSTDSASDLRKSPPMLQEALMNLTRQHAAENRGRQVETPGPSMPRRKLPKRRSASEGWNGRRALHDL